MNKITTITGGFAQESDFLLAVERSIQGKKVDPQEEAKRIKHFLESTLPGATLAALEDLYNPRPGTPDVWLTPDKFDGVFRSIQIKIPSVYLHPSNIDLITHNLDYALSVNIGGAKLSSVYIVSNDAARGVTLQYDYDASKHLRTDPDYVSTFETAVKYIKDGTPKYRTNKNGPIGTQKFAGIGNISNIQIRLK